MIYTIKDNKGRYVDSNSICIDQYSGKHSYISYTGVASGIKYYKDKPLAENIKKELEYNALKLDKNLTFEVVEYDNIWDITIGKVIHRIL